MAKMFYTLEEAAARLGQSPDEVARMAATGQIQEFRDREKLMFKVEQIDLLAGGDDAGGPIGLADSGVPVIGLADSAEGKALGNKKEESVLGLVDSKESTGISIFDADETEKADPSAVTQVSDSIAPVGFSVDSGGSGSGLLDLTREADDTSLGAVLDDIYPGGGDDAAGSAAGGTGLFAGGGDRDIAMADAGAPATAAVLPVVVEYYDGAGSGLATGLAIGALIPLLLAALVMVTALAGDATVAGIALTLAANLWMFVGIFAGVTLLLGIIGWFVGKTFQ